MGDMDQDDIDKLLADALGESSEGFAFDDSDGGAQSQDEIDALIAAASEGGVSDASLGGNDSPQSQSDIDDLIAAAAGGSDDGSQSQEDIDALIAAAAGGDLSSSAAEEALEDTGAQSQDDIDALIAAAAGENIGELGAENLDEGPQSQDDIDALIAGAADGDDEDGGFQSQDDIDALIAGADAGLDDDEGSQSQDDIDALIAGASEDEDLGVQSQDDIDALIAGASDDADEEEDFSEEDQTFDQNDIDALISGGFDDEEPEEEESISDFDSMLSSIGEEAVASQESSESEEDISDVDEEVADMAAQAQEIQQAFASRESAPPPPPPPAVNYAAAGKAPAMPQLSEEQMQNLQQSLSLSGSSGEVENLAGQMSGLLGQLSERTRRFQSAWLNADQENRELRHFITLKEQKAHALEGERLSLLGEIESLRKRSSQIEGEKVAAAESHRTEVASLELKLREQESRNNMLQSEVRALKEELENARNLSTGSDLESRRARFEAERLSSELVAEKQERQRLQRALDNREKELQAMQAQSAGHASTLFLDELHRLVRRLESELDIRTSSAHEALSVIDRMEFTPQQQMYATTMRAAISSACGLTPDEGDALKILDNQAQIGQASLEPAAKPGEDSFTAALERYDFARASGIASAQIRSGSQKPLDFMEDVYKCAALRRPETSDKLDDIAAMLRGIKAIQEASDRSRGRESNDTEKLFVLIFDYLHALVRMKLVSRATPAIWDLFLELRGRFSFLTSDRQWNEYRDRVLSGVHAKSA